MKQSFLPMFAVFYEYAAHRVAEHPLTLAKQNAGKLRDKTRIRIGCGSLDGPLPRNLELHDLLTKLGMAHDYEVEPDVAHDSPLYYRKLGTRADALHAKSLTGAAKSAP